MKTILTPIDFSPVSRKIVDHTIALARALDARVVLLTVLLEPVFLEEFAPPPPSIARILVGSEKSARRKLAEFEQRLTAAAIPAKTLLLDGSPAERILAEARRLAADYIVVGSHGHSAFFELVVGSTTQLVLRRARCPVLVVPAARPRQRRGRR